MPSSFEHHSHHQPSTLSVLPHHSHHQPGTLPVLLDMRCELQTTRTPEFIGLGKRAKMHPIESNSASEFIIGVLDTGVWPESKSYDDTRLGPVPSNWKGICDSTKDEGAKAVAGEEEEEEGEVGSSLTLETPLENIAISIDDEENDRNHSSSQSVLMEENDTQHNEVIEEIEIKEDTGESDQKRQMIINTNALRLKSDGGIEDSSHIDIHGHHEAQTRRNDDKNQKVIFVITNFCLEVISSVLDQLSSEKHDLYAPLGMIFSFGGMLICIVELVFKGRTQKVGWRWKEKLPWFYYPSQQSHQLRFGTFKDIIGCVCALCQCIVTTINYIYDNKPIKISVWPIIYAFGQLCSELLENPLYN